MITVHPLLRAILRVPDCVQWTNADLSTKGLSGSDIIQIDGLSKSATTLIQSSPTNRPTYVPDVINDRGVMRFNGIDQWFDYLTNLTGTEFTIFICYSSTSTPNNGALLSNDSDLNFYLNKDSVSGNYQANSVTSIEPFDTGAGVFKVATHVIRNANDIELYFNGPMNISGDPSATIDIGLVGKRFDNNYAAVDITDIVIFDRVLNYREQFIVEGALKSWVGIYELEALPVIYDSDYRRSVQTVSSGDFESISSFSGNGKELTQITPGDRIQKNGKSTVNNLSGATYNGTTGYLSTTDSDILNVGGSPYSFMSVSKIVDASTTDGAYFAFNEDAGFLTYDPSSLLYYDGVSFKTVISKDVRSFNPWVLTFTHDGTNVTAWSNFIQETTALASLAAGQTSFSIGMETDASIPSNHYEGDRSRDVLYDQELTLNQYHYMQRLFTYQYNIFPFNVNLYRDVAAWIDMADADTVSLNSGNVSFVYDKSFNNNHAQQPTASSQGLYDLGAVNGNNALLLDGIDDFLQFISDVLGTGNVDYDVFVVCKSQLPSTNPCILGLGSVESNNRQLFIRKGASQTLTTGWYSVNLISGNDAWESDKTVIINTKYDSAVGRQQYVDSVDAGSDTATSLNLSTGSQYIGAVTSGGGPSSYFKGYFCELIAFRKERSAVERQEIRSKAIAKWGS